MQIIHRISIASTPEIRNELATMGIVVGSSGFVTFEVDEAHETWPAIQRWIAKREVVDYVSTKFSKSELAAARWLSLVPDWHHGYPQPDEDNFGYRKATYDLADYCSECGSGAKQKAPFQMKGEPKWGRNSILQLNWVFDEYFVTPEVWTKIFKPHGIGHRPVTNKKGVELQTVVQLLIEEEVHVVTDGLPGERCASCGRMKYLPVVRGPFPPISGTPSAQLVKTKESFGSGGRSYKGVLLSQALGSALQSEKIRGASVKPVKNLG